MKQESTRKRVMIYARDIKPQIDVLKEKIKENGEALAQTASNMTPPYPIGAFTSEKYHYSDTGAAINSALKLLLRDFVNISSKELKASIQTYIDLPSRNSGEVGNNQPGTELVHIDDDTVGLSQKFGMLLRDNDFSVPYMIRGDSVSHKVTCCIALILAGNIVMSHQEVS